MAFFSQTGFEPKRKFRFLIDFTSFGGGLQIMATKCSKPTYELTGVTEHRVLNHQFKFPGIIKWNDIDVSFIDAIEPNIGSKFYNALRNAGYVEPVAANDLVTGITKQSAHITLGEVKIKQLTGGGTSVIGGAGDATPAAPLPTNWSDEWVLKNAFIKSVAFGELDYNSEDIVGIDVGIVYDYATYIPGPVPLQELASEQQKT